MTFEYRDDATCDKLVAQPDTDDNRKPVVFISTTGLNDGVYIPLDRVEEVVAGIRDAARTAAARQTTGQADTKPLRPRAERCPEPECTDEQQCWRCDYEESQHAARRPALTCTSTHPVHPTRCILPGRHAVPHTDGAVQWPDAAPAVGQPAEAQPADPWTPANLHFLRFALGCAAAVMYSEDDFTDEDHAALDQLRAFAGPEPGEVKAAVLDEAADETEHEDHDCSTLAPCQPCAIRTAVAAKLRRMAEEARS